jgi:hypothetical protein
VSNYQRSAEMGGVIQSLADLEKISILTTSFKRPMYEICFSDQWAQTARILRASCARAKNPRGLSYGSNIKAFY